MNPLPSLAPYEQLSDDYRRIEQAILYLENHYKEQPGLEQVASSIGLSEYHFQRLFTRWAGISPKRFLQFITKENAKQLLDRSENLLDTTYEVGLSSLGRLHDLFVTTEAVSPGEYKSRGAGLTIRYGLHPTPFGECLIGVTERGICHLGFVQTSEGDAIDNLVSEWKNARMIEDRRSLDLGGPEREAGDEVGALVVAAHPYDKTIERPSGDFIFTLEGLAAVEGLNARRRGPGNDLAVEAAEGTDAAIERGGKLARSGSVVVKVSEPQQDLRFDVPAVGLETVNRLHEVRGRVLAIEAGKTILLEKDSLLKHAEACGISLVGVSG